MDDTYDAIAIGSGLGALTAAALCARAGLRVLVLERLDGFGGAANRFVRHGQVFESSLHETTMPGDGDTKAALFRDLGLDGAIEFVPVPALQEVRGPMFGAPFTLPHGYEAIVQAVTARFPQHAGGVRAFLADLDHLRHLLSTTAGRGGPVWWLKHLPGLLNDLRHAGRDFSRSLGEMLTRHFGDDELVKTALVPNLGYYHDDPDELWWAFFCVAQGEYYRRGGAYIRGGSTVLVDRLLGVVRDAGGRALAGRTVDGIVLDDAGRAAGVRFRDRHGRTDTVRAPIVLAGCAPDHLATMLPEDRRAAFLEPYAHRDRSLTLMMASFLLDRPGAELGITAYSTVLIPGWMTGLKDLRPAAALAADAPGARMPGMTVVDYGQIDAGLPGQGPAPVSATMLDRLDNWQGRPEAEYRAHKERWLAAIVATLDAEWPGFAGAVRFADLATARTMAHYLGTPDGALYGFAPRPPPRPGPPGRVKTEVAGLWLASAWGGTGGFTGTMICGRDAARAALAGHRG